MPTNPDLLPRFTADIHQNPFNRHLLTELPKLGLPQCHLVAGALFQTVWNLLSDQPPGQNIKDYDVFYFDPDTSWEAEDKVIQRLAALFGPDVEVRNQARVHLWYEQKFGHARPPLPDSETAIGGFLVQCTCVGINVDNGTLVAPFGLADLYAGVLKRNAPSAKVDLFYQKAANYRARWPWLTIV